MALTLRSHLILFAVTLVIGTAVGLEIICERAAMRYLQQSIGTELGRGAEDMAEKLDREISMRYADLQRHATLLADFELLDRPDALRIRLEALNAAYSGFAWLGYTDADGMVLAANGRLLEGQNVSQHAWFKFASREPFIGVSQHTVLSEIKLNGDGKESPRTIDIAMLVVKRDHTMAGVLAARLDWRWVQDIAQSMAHNERSDILIVNAGNLVLFGPSNVQDRPLILGSVSQAQQNHPGFREERWPDGKIYLTGYGQTHAYKNYPGLNWSILYRQKIGEAYSPVAALRLQFLVWSLIATAAAALLSWLTGTPLVKSLIVMKEAAKSLEPEAVRSEIPKFSDYREETVLANTLQVPAPGLTRVVAQSRVPLEFRATGDVASHLPNREHLTQITSQIIRRATKDGDQVAMITVRLAHLQMISDTISRHVANSAFQLTASRLEECVGGIGIVGHVGDCDLVVVLNARDDMATRAGLLAARLLQAITEPLVIENNKFSLSASVGISLFPKDGHCAITLLDCSDIALHQAQLQGNYVISFYENGMDALVRERIEIERELRLALEHRQLELHYQPYVSLGSGAIVGVDTSICWHHLQKGLMSPAKFIPVAEASGLIVAIGLWVLETACAQARAWCDEGLPILRIGVNVPAQLFSQADFVTQVERALAMYRIPAGSLKLEINESLLLQDVEHNISHMNELTALGVRIAIDDFGTGYSSLSYLKRFPISELKIDQAFVSGLTSQSDDASILIAIILLAHNLKLTVLAEGIETAEQLRILRHAGCDEILGSIFSGPIRSVEMATLLRTKNKICDVALDNMPPPEVEYGRIAALMRFKLLDTPPEAQFDELTQLAARICGTPIALMSLVDSTRQWFKSRVNFADTETRRSISFCGYAILGEEIFEVANASEDQRFRNHPLVTGSPHIVFYAGAPLVSYDGYRIGTLCVIDDVPRELTDFQRYALSMLSRQAMRLIENNSLTRELRKKEGERVAIADASPLGMFRTDARHNCVYINKKYTAITGLKLDQAVGQGWVDAVHPEDRSRFLASLELSTLRHTDYLNTQRFIRPDGSTVFCRVAGAPISTDSSFTGFVGTLEDVTERQGLSDALASSEKRLKTITDNLPVLITYVDRERRVRFANATLESWMGVAPAMLRDRRFEVVFGTTIYAEHRVYIERALDGNQVEFDIMSSEKGVEKHLHSIYIPDRDQNGKVLGFYTLTTNVTTLKLSEQRLTKLARLDSLTNLPNRYFLNELLSGAVTRSNHLGAKITILYLDIDHFKAINDTYGHAVGDAVLVEFATRLKQCVRAEDIVARLAGDEFVIVIESSDNPDEPQQAAQRIAEKIKQPWQVGQRLIHVSTSIGAASGYPFSSTAADLLELADKALYDAKRNGRNMFKLTVIEQ